MKLRMRLGLVLTLFVLASFVPSVYLGYENLDQLKHREIESNWSELQKELVLLTTMIEKNINTYQLLFNSFTNTKIKELVEWRYNNVSLTEEWNTLSEDEKATGDFYPQRIAYLDLYQEILSYFNKSFHLHEGIEMIRVFYRDGNVLVGIKNGNEDISDYKGDKSWFRATMKIIDEDYIYISPISIARATNTPAIRFVKPVVINNQSLGLIVANFGVDIILNPLSNYNAIEEVNKTTGFLAMIDPNYETAEGDKIGEVYLVNTLDPSTEFDEENAGNISFKATMFENETSPEKIYKGSINIEGISYLYAYQWVSIGERKWIVIDAVPESHFYENAQIVYETTMIKYRNLFLGIVGTAILILLLLVKTISKPVTDLHHSISDILEGKGEIKLAQPKQKGEIADLILLFRAFIKNQNNFLSMMQNLSDELISYAEELSASSEEITASSENIASTQEQISRGASGQVIAITETQRKFEQLVNGIEEIKRQAEEINVISSFIENISEQTDMLALNASIEAARAGRAGSGFKVVADQIRNLAIEASRAAKNTHKMLSSIQKITEEQAQHSNDILKAFDGVLAVSEEVSASTEEASAASEQQASSMSSINQTAQQLLKLSEKIQQRIANTKFNVKLI